MTRYETTGIRPTAFSTWHRTLDGELTMTDVDACEYCRRCRRPLALYETARDTGNTTKPSRVVHKLAAMAGLPSWTVLYTLDVAGEIDGFRVRQDVPRPLAYRPMRPMQFRDLLRDLRTWHVCEAPA